MGIAGLSSMQLSCSGCTAAVRKGAEGQPAASCLCPQPHAQLGTKLSCRVLRYVSHASFLLIPVTVLSHGYPASGHLLIISRLSSLTDVCFNLPLYLIADSNVLL